jgi:poly-gamma-glutamate synthesis protein (capsule biosynthesis protein)
MILTHRVGRAIVARKDPGAPFRTLASLLEDVDFSYANLEGPLRQDTPLDGLTEFSFRALNLANNHIMDGGVERLLMTSSRLRAEGIVTSGVGKDLEHAWAPAFIQVRGVRIGFLGASYTSKNSSRAVRLPYVARVDQIWELREALLDTRKKADFIVVAMHAGTEYVRFPAAEQVQFARAAIDYGADIVVGTHPHVVQRAERYHEKYIFYSLGNFIFDQDRPPHVLESAALALTLGPDDGTLDRLEVVPLYNPDTLSPQLADADTARAILGRMGLTARTLVPISGAKTGGLPQSPTGPK